MPVQTDKDLLIASKLAYVDFNPAAVELHPDWTIKEYLDNYPEINASVKEQLSADEYSSLTSGERSDWKLVNSVNANDGGNGFCACTIDTGSGDAIVGFRGSEKSDANIAIHDWIVADGGLAGTAETSQQRDARLYLEMVANEYGDRFDTISPTGHSLGGNLAEHATITASDKLISKIDRTVSFDGPGYSDEYLKAHEKQIKKNAHKINHYQYSFVGALLNPIPGTNYKSIVTNGKDGFSAHSLTNVKLDENGMVDENGKMDSISKKLHSVSLAVDFIENFDTLYQLIILYDMFQSGTMPETKEIIDFLINIKNEIQIQINRTIGNPTDFRVDTNFLENASQRFSEYTLNLENNSQQTTDVKNDISVLLKAASLYTLSYKLKKSADNIEKLSKKTRKMGDSAVEIAAELINTEKMIIS